MNKTAIKKFAIWARQKLIDDMSYKAGLMGITKSGIKSALPQSTKDIAFYDIGIREPYAITGEAMHQRQRLAELIEQKAQETDYTTAYNSILEEVAYTWFNRLIAIRFMEVNDYLPSHIRVLSSESNTKLEPDLVTTPFDADLEWTAEEEAAILHLKTDNQVDELFRLLFVKQCNALNAILPKLFEKTADYTELLLNISVTDRDGVVYHLVHDIDEDDFNVEKGGQVEIIGWLYQYYNTEPKDDVFALLKKNVKITKERIPAATQLFTPDWIVRYMVENSLGRLWLEGHPNDALKAGWKYYLDEAEQEAEVEAQLAKIREEYKTIRPEDIKVIDPCMGSGHILVYAFDVLMQIYESAGYNQREAAKSILENNLYGLDIDDRAFQLAYFAVMMKARQYNRRILNGETDCHVYAIQESNEIGGAYQLEMGNFLLSKEHQETLNYLLEAFKDAKEYGSILKLENRDYVGLMEAWKYTASQTTENLNMTLWYATVEEKVTELIKQAILLSQKYDVVVTNSPYMGSSGMGARLSEYVKKNYPDSKSDLFAVFIEKCGHMVSRNRYQAMITQHAWMFLSSFEKLRVKLLNVDTVNMAHLGARAFEEIGGEVVQTTSFVIRKSRIPQLKGTYCRLIEPTSQKGKEEMFLNGENRYFAEQDDFTKIPGIRVAYWISDKLKKQFEMRSLSCYADTRRGLQTGDSQKFIRNWYEVSEECEEIHPNILTQKSSRKWFLLNSGGSYRRWYGNIVNVVNWEDNGHDIKATGKAIIPSEERYFDEVVSWNKISSGKIAVRYQPVGIIPGDASPFLHSQLHDHNIIMYAMGVMNSKVSSEIVKVLSPTLNFEVGNIAQIPISMENQEKNKILRLVEICVDISKTDWDSFETSWDFQQHPLVQLCHGVIADDGHEIAYIEDAFNEWQYDCNTHFHQLKANEEELNRIFIDIYGLQDELTPEVEDKDVTVHYVCDTKEDAPEELRGSSYLLTKRDIMVSLISYAVGCMFGRYSVDVPGLAYAGGEWDDAKYSTFIPDDDNILPITDEAYFEDDIVGVFCAWLKRVYGAETLEENLDFIAKALGNKGSTSREIIRNYFLNDFFKDHCKTYSVTGSGKRPIYWLFDSGKQNGFKALVYLHRYDEDTIGNLRVDYLHRMEHVYESEIARMQGIIDNSAAAREVAAATKRKEKLQKQLKECRTYDEKIAHLALSRIAIDLDDGVKVNYRKVQTAADGQFYEVLADSKSIMSKA